MALPDDFSPAQHLLAMLIGTHNRIVQQTFLGVPDNDIETALGGMKVACLIEDDDTTDLIILRLLLFWFEFKANLPAPIYGIPVADYQSEIGIPTRPQVKLLFRETYSLFLAENKLQQATAQISWRLINETSATINPSKAEGIALRIKEVFTNFTFEKGVANIVYIDKPRGCHFSVLAESKSEAVRLITTVLEVAELPFEETRVRVVNPDEIFPVVPAPQEIYGQERKGPRRRPITQVKFYRAELSIHGLTRPIVLVDTANPFDALVR